MHACVSVGSNESQARMIDYPQSQGGRQDVQRQPGFDIFLLLNNEINAREGGRVRLVHHQQVQLT